VSDASISVVTVFVDYPPQVIPITKKLWEILAENPELEVVAIKRGTAKVLVVARCHLTEWALSRELTWNDNWNAWSHRPASGVYQQIIVFMPEDE
jgi:hypothetical protein